MVFHALLRANDEGARKLFKSIEAGDIHAYTSALTFDELACPYLGQYLNQEMVY